MANTKPDWVGYTPLKWVAAPRIVSTAKLSPREKRQLWEGIKAAKPALANMIKADPAIEQIMETFGASLVFEQPEFDTLMEAGKTNNNG